MTEVTTRLEQLNKLRNAVSERKVASEASALYFERVAKKLKSNTQPRVDAENNLAAQTKAVKDDRIYLECIDELIEKEKAKNEV